MADFVLGYLEAIGIGKVRWQSTGKWLTGVLVLVSLPFSSYGDSFKIGPLTGNLGYQAGFQYTDNLNNNYKKQSDFTPIIGPTIDFGAGQGGLLGATTAGGDEFSLHVGLSFSVKPHLSTNWVETSFSSPISVDLTIPIKLKYDDWKGSIGESFTYNNSSLENAVLTGQNASQAAQYNNTVSANVGRDLGKSGIDFSLLRTDKIAPTSQSLSETDYQVSATPWISLRENYRLFWSNAYGLVFPGDPLKQEVRSITTSVGVSGQITPAFTGSLSLGYGVSHLVEKTLGPGQGIFGGIFDPNTLPAQNLGGISSSLAGSYTHPLHPSTTYSISVYHSPGVTALLSASSIQSVTGVSLSLAHQLTAKTVITLPIQYTNLQSLGISSSHETENLISTGMSFSRQISDHMSWIATYQYVARFSNLPNSTYDTTLVSMIMNYHF